MNTDIAFVPVKGTEEKIKSLTPQKGYLYFTTDTKKIFMEQDSELISMGGNSSVFYGSREITQIEIDGGQTDFYFLYSEINDGEAAPAVNDLILNIPDGGFYRVLSIGTESVLAQRIAVSGGGSGGTGGGGSNTPVGSLQMKSITPQNNVILKDDTFFIEFEIIAKDSDDNPIIETGKATLLINNTAVATDIIIRHGINKVQVDQYLDSTKETNTVKIISYMNVGGASDAVANRTWSVKVIKLNLEWNWNYGESSYINSDTFQLRWKPYGGVDCTTYITFYDTQGIKVKEYSQAITAQNTGKEVVSNLIDSFPYGAYTAEMYLETIVNGQPYKTNTISHELTFIKDGVSDIITAPYYEKVVKQYNTLQIPFLAYNPSKEKVLVKFLVNGDIISSEEYDKDLHYWTYTVTETGKVTLTLQAENENIKKEFEVIVEAIDLNVTEAPGQKFSLKANAFSTLTQLKEWNQNGVTVSLSDNFEQRGGGLRFENQTDGSVWKYIYIPQGTNLTINYAPFKRNDINTTGLNLKICFKAMNCYKYDAQILNCVDGKIGLNINAQMATLSSTNEDITTQFCENNYIELEAEIWKDVPASGYNPGDRFMMFWVDGVPTAVKTYEEKENFQQQTSTATNIVIGSQDCDVYLYLVKAYEIYLSEDYHLDNFIVDAPSTEEMLARYNRNNILDNIGRISPEKLVQQNPNCRAYVYDIPRMTTKKGDPVSNCEYYELYNNNNTFANPYYHGLKGDEGGVRIRVQGTSSAAYGAAAFNLRTEFQDGLTDKDNNFVEGWEISPTAIPIDYVCTKVNVASCENANNVVNAEWYNKFQPYHDGHRRKKREDGKLYRDCMEFNSGVVFVKDHNTKKTFVNAEGKPTKEVYITSNIFLDEDGYIENPYFKMYAIGNMGNDKKNVDVFHDTSDGSVACCVEVTNNNTEQQWMKVEIGLDQFDLKDEDLNYEFRYPDGNDKASLAQKQAWVDFVNWMAANNPAACQPENILKAVPAELTENSYKKNKYFIYTEEAEKDGVLVPAHYEKALNDFDENQTYYNIISIEDSGEDELIEVMFDTYTYKGFDPPGYEGKSNPTGVTLKGTKENKYKNIRFSHDTKDYRVARMLSECEEHLVMDSVVFHYLFIERHTMIDNVAKNTFWSTEDLVHWDLTKNYDNDTSDGNDNSGHLTYSYGKEIKDGIYNGKESSWLNFIDNLDNTIQNLYSQLQTKGAWDPTNYLAEFNKHQNIIPERCWIYNYFHHYIRPRRLGLDSTFLARLEGGKKVHQRQQFETYQNFYMDSKYIAGSAFNDSTGIDARLNSGKKNVNGVEIDTWNEDVTIPVSFYVDCYASANIGGSIMQSGRLTRGEKFGFPVGKKLSSPQDATCYIYGASMIQTLEGIPNVYPSYISLDTAGKLQELELGSGEEGYYNPKLKKVAISNNSMLQSVNIQNCGIEAYSDEDGSTVTGMGTVSVGAAYRLNDLKIDGSTINALILPENGLLETLHLNSLASIKMVGLKQLKDIQVDEGIYSSIKDIYITDTPAMNEHSYKMILGAKELQRYHLTGFNWTITSIDDLVLNNNQVIGIKIIDKLIDKLIYTDNKSTALIGEIRIDVDCECDEYTLYEAYAAIYPNLNIVFTNKVTLNKAPQITFYSNEYNAESNSIHYSVKGNGNKTIGWLISEEGPTKVAMTDPYKPSTNEYQYTFEGKWTNDNGVIYDSVQDIVPTEDMNFYPVYTSIKKIYTITYYSHDNQVINSYEFNWHDSYKVLNYAERSEEGLNIDERWAFLGWNEVNYGDNPQNVKFINPDEELTVIGNKEYYAHYKKENTRTNASASKYFTFNETNGTISINPEYRDTFSGKLTIPKQYNNKDVLILGDFSDMPHLTYVYFEDENNHKCHTVSTGAFKLSKIDSNGQANTILQGVFLPPAIKTIGDYAFYQCINLETVSLNDNITTIGKHAFSGYSSGELNISRMKVKLNQLPKNLTTLGEFGFYGCELIEISELPDNITSIESQTFVFCDKLKINNLNNVEKIGMMGFYGSAREVTELTFPKVKSIGAQAFEGAYINIKTVTVTSDNESIVFSIFGDKVTYNVIN